MRTYCTLIINSETDRQLKKTVQSLLGLKSDDVVDTQTPDLIARREKLANLLEKPLVSPPRYFWRLSSLDFVNSANLQDHIAWLLNQVHSNRSIHEITLYGCNTFLTCFWTSHGRGGGPTLSSDLLKSIVDHQLELQFDFYVEDESFSKF